MAHTNETQNYKLPQFADNDQPTWLGDFNGAMNKIDADMNTIGANSSTALSAANNAVNRVGQVETTIAGVQSTANNAYSLATTNEKGIDALDAKVAQLETKFPITSNSLSNGAVTAAKLDQTAIASMWAGLTVKRFSSTDANADNAGMSVPSGGRLEGFYIVEMGILVLNSMTNEKYTGNNSAEFTLPSYVPNFAASGKLADACVVVHNTSNDFVSWTSLHVHTANTRNIGITSAPANGNGFSLMGSVVIFMGINSGLSLNVQDAYRRMNPTVG